MASCCHLRCFSLQQWTSSRTPSHYVSQSSASFCQVTWTERRQEIVERDCCWRQPHHSRSVRFRFIATWCLCCCWVLRRSTTCVPYGPQRCQGWVKCYYSGSRNFLQFTSSATAQCIEFASWRLCCSCWRNVDTWFPQCSQEGSKVSLGLESLRVRQRIL